MIRALTIIAAVSFVLALGCFAGALTVAGGPFYIGEDWRFHRADWPDNERAPPLPALPDQRGAI